MEPADIDASVTARVRNHDLGAFERIHGSGVGVFQYQVLDHPGTTHAAEIAHHLERLSLGAVHGENGELGPLLFECGRGIEQR